MFIINENIFILKYVLYIFRMFILYNFCKFFRLKEFLRYELLSIFCWYLEEFFVFLMLMLNFVFKGKRKIFESRLRDG